MEMGNVPKRQQPDHRADNNFSIYIDVHSGCRTVFIISVYYNDSVGQNIK